MPDSYKSRLNNTLIKSYSNTSDLSDMIKIDKNAILIQPDTAYRPAPGSIRRYKRKRTKYCLIPVLILGDLIFAFLIILGISAWCIPAFINKQDIASATAIPLSIYLAAIFLSSYLISYIIKAKSFIPIFLMFLSFMLITVTIAGYRDIVITGLLLKAFYSLSTALTAFLLVKLIHKKRIRKIKRSF